MLYPEVGATICKYSFTFHPLVENPLPVHPDVPLVPLVLKVNEVVPPGRLTLGVFPDVKSQEIICPQLKTEHKKVKNSNLNFIIEYILYYFWVQFQIDFECKVIN